LPTEDKEERRRFFVARLNAILLDEFRTQKDPGVIVSVHVFGSSENKLGTDTSDGLLYVTLLMTVDVCVVTTSMEMNKTCLLAERLDRRISLSTSNKRFFKRCMRFTSQSTSRQNHRCRIVCPPILI
jgi:DNA polymerase sigma